MQAAAEDTDKQTIIKHGDRAHRNTHTHLPSCHQRVTYSVGNPLRPREAQLWVIGEYKFIHTKTVEDLSIALIETLYLICFTMTYSASFPKKGCQQSWEALKWNLVEYGILSLTTYHFWFCYFSSVFSIWVISRLAWACCSLRLFINNCSIAVNDVWVSGTGVKGRCYYFCFLWNNKIHCEKQEQDLTKVYWSCFCYRRIISCFQRKIIWLHSS